MKQIRRHLSYANVMSSIAVFVVLGGAAVAASQLPKKSVGTPQLKANAVTTSKIKRNAVTKGKIKKNAVDNSKLADKSVTNSKLADSSVTNSKLADNAVTGSKIADGSVTGADINSGSTSFSQVVAEIRGGQQALSSSGVYLFNNPGYTQGAGEDNQFIGAIDVNFAASCTAPRSLTAYLLIDSANPAAPNITNELAGFAVASDNNAGSVNRRAEFVPFGGTAGMSRFAPNANTPHTFSVFIASAFCSGGTSGISTTGAGVDVIGTK